MAANQALVHPDIAPDDDGNPVVVSVPPSTAKVLKTRGWKDHKPADSTPDQATSPAGNASTDEWRAHAEGLGLDVPDGASRDDIQQLVAAHQA